MVNIWDGLHFRDVDPAEAERLVAEGKAQTTARTPAFKLKTRAQLAGYATTRGNKYKHRRMQAEGTAE